MPRRSAPRERLAQELLRDLASAGAPTPEYLRRVVDAVPLLTDTELRRLLEAIGEAGGQARRPGPPKPPHGARRAA